MSTSHPDLPAVPEVPIQPPLLDKRTRETVTDLRWLIALVLGSIAIIVTATVSTVAFAQDAGTKAAVEQTKVVKAQAEATAKALEQHLLDDSQEKREMKLQLSEISADIRALYKAQMTGERQYRLERPTPSVPDGGP